MCYFKCGTVINYDRNFNEADNFKVDTVYSVHSIKRNWFMTLKLNNCDINFKIDTGSQVDILNINTVKQIKLKLKVCKDVKLRNFDGSDIKIVGMCDEYIQYNKAKYMAKFYIVDFDTPIRSELFHSR